MNDIRKMPIQPPLSSSDRMKQFVAGATNIAWSLITAVPPLVPSCDEQEFREDLHEKVPSWDERRQSNCKLKYTRPVLYTNSLGVVTQRGLVRNAKSDEGKYYCITQFKHTMNQMCLIILIFGSQKISC